MQTRLALFTRARGAIQDFSHRFRRAIQPGSTAIQGAAAGILLAAGMVYLFMIINSAAVGPWQFRLVGSAVLLASGALLLWLGQGIAALIGLLARVPWRLRWTIAGAIALGNMALMGVKDEMKIAVPLVVIVLSALAGAGVWSLARGRGSLASLQRAVAAAGMALGILGLAVGLGWFLAWRGTPPPVPVNAAAQSGAPLARVALPDPGRPGPYTVKTLTYGSGTDRYRPEYGQEANLRTEPVDGSLLLNGSWNGLSGSLRTLAWGFDPGALPLNGRVWYPDGPGPYPLVLMVHGNHNMMEFSDPGYAYLGELLASRGYIFVSVDENFLNGGLPDMINKFTGENDARGWLLLEHLRVWHAWNEQPGQPFSGRVDTGRIALAGHSRGGEAAAIAAAFNRLPAYPDNARLKFNYGYNIRSVVAIAPIDAYYRPAARDLPLSGVSFFVLQGSHDSDLTSFHGLNQYDRVTLAGEEFKTALYIYRANHGQFNTVWGDDDLGGLVTGFLNRAALLAGEDQRQIAQVYISAFLDATLRGERGYLPLFQDARAAGDGWLPDTIYLSRFDQAGDQLMAGYEEDIDLRTVTLPGGTAAAENLDAWREGVVSSKWGERESHAVYLGWNEDRIASYTIALPGVVPGLSAVSALIFDLADALQDPAPVEKSPPEQGRQPPAPRQPIDLSIILVDARGQEARVSLGDYRLLQPQLEARLYKARLFERTSPSEPVFQSYAIPLAEFARANPAFAPGDLARIRFVFDQTPRGSVILDAVGFRP